MVNKKTWNTFFKELEETGNVYRSCKKVGIAPSTYYRTYNDNFKFKDRADEAIEIGKRNPPEMAEIGLFQKIREGEWPAIKFMLERRHPDYQPKSKDSQSSQLSPQEVSKRYAEEWGQVSTAHKKLIEAANRLAESEKLTDGERKKLEEIIPPVLGIEFVDFSERNPEEPSTQPPDTPEQ